MKEETGARWNEKLEGQEECQTEKIKQEGGRCGRSECVVRGRWGREDGGISRTRKKVRTNEDRTGGR